MRIMLFTSRGERVMQPNFGSDFLRSSNIGVLGVSIAAVNRLSPDGDLGSIPSAYPFNLCGSLLDNSRL
jgi:hypothetical protein